MPSPPPPFFLGPWWVFFLFLRDFLRPLLSSSSSYFEMREGEGKETEYKGRRAKQAAPRASCGPLFPLVAALVPVCLVAGPRAGKRT